MVTTASRRAAPHSIAPHRTAIIVPQVNINFLTVDGANSMRQRIEAAVCGLQRQSFGHEVGNNDDAGLGLHFPRSRKVPFGPDPRPNRVALSFNFVRFTRGPIAILGSIIALYRPIPPEKQCNATAGSKRIKRLVTGRDENEKIRPR